MKDEKSALLCAALSHDGRTLATGGRGIPTKLWQIDEGHFVLKHTLPTKDETRGVAFSQNDITLATGGTANTVQRWPVASGLELLALEPTPGAINSLAFSADDERLTAGLHNGKIRTWYAPKVKHVSPFLP